VRQRDAVSSRMACLVESEESLPHQVIRTRGFLNAKRSVRLSITEQHSHPDLPSGAAESQAVASHPLPDNHALLEVPLLSESSQRNQNLRGVPGLLCTSVSAILKFPGFAA